MKFSLLIIIFSFLVFFGQMINSPSIRSTASVFGAGACDEVLNLLYAVGKEERDGPVVGDFLSRENINFAKNSELFSKNIYLKLNKEDKERAVLTMALLNKMRPNLNEDDLYRRYKVLLRYCGV